MPDILLAIEQLTVYRDTSPAIQGVTFTLEAGTDTAIIGPNGAGKSTLVQAMLGILPRHSGHVWVLGQPLSRSGYLPAAIREQIAYLPQNFLFDRKIPMTVSEFVGLGWDQLGFCWPWQGVKERRRAIDQALGRVDATHLRHQMISELSGGETKRVLLAYCLVRPRRILILDEAPAGLDFRAEAEFYALLEGLKREQQWAILQISHDLDMVRKTCDRVLCLNRQLLCQGRPEVALDPENLVKAYGSEFVRYRHSHH